jgi:L-ascorbate metabolism protein UlaG (beta-lactamase superfamily)
VREKRVERPATVVVSPSERFRTDTTALDRRAAFRAVTKIGLRNLRESFSRTAIPLPGRLPSFDPGPAAASVWWAGQSTALVGLSGRWFLTDPNLAPVIGRFCRRVVQAGFTAADLPPLDVVVVSHAHMDHMDFPTLLSLPGRPRLLLAPGSRRYVGRVRRSGRYAEVFEAPHWVGRSFGSVTVTAVPAVHDGWRYGVDSAFVEADASGFVFQSDEATVYYAGDTAYHPELFREIGRRFAVDVLICPMGPLEPRAMMKWFHADPADMLRIFQDVGARHLVPVHHNTFVQSLEEPTDTANEFFALRREHPRAGDTLLLRQGERAVYRRGTDELRLAEVQSPYPPGFDDPRIPGEKR